jgi:hypothetical protein
MIDFLGEEAAQACYLVEHNASGQNVFLQCNPNILCAAVSYSLMPIKSQPGNRSALTGHRADM